MFPLRKWMYHRAKAPKLFVFEDELEIDECRKAGWCDSPADFNKPASSTDEGGSTDNSDDNDDDAGDEDDEDIDELLEVFGEDPASLTKKQMIVLGKSLDVTLKKSWKEETMIAKLQEKLDGDDETTD